MRPRRLAGVGQALIGSLDWFFQLASVLASVGSKTLVVSAIAFIARDESW